MNQKNTDANAETLSVAITGSGGSGVVTTGQMLLTAVANAGYHGLMSRSAGPQIRGGESAVMLRVGTQDVTCLDDRFELMMALDWLNVSRFAEEIPLDHNSLIICDPDAGDIPEVISSSGARVMQVPLTQIAKGITGGRINMVALGVLADLLDLPEGSILKVVDQTLAKKGKKVVQSSHQCISSGYSQEKPFQPAHRLPNPGQITPRWNISGNESSGLGALRGGVRFVAAYPITPASEILEYLAPNLEEVGGALLQAEDELASVNMIIGSSFGGVASLTATSGPGLSLMMEGLGLAVTSETPVVIANVMRGGPSTGIPTKSEQSDLNISLYGFHGDAPHIVIGALDIRDCAFATEWAVHLAEQLQTVAIVLSDQSQGQARAVIDPPGRAPQGKGRKIALPEGSTYNRYALTDDCVSPMAIPGTKGGIYTADGLEHNPRGTPSSMPMDHQQQLDKRLNKFAGLEHDGHWARIQGEGEACIVTWGSSSGASMEAAQRLTAAGTPVRVIAIRLLMPLPEEDLRQALSGATRVLTVEQNHQGQLFHYLHSKKMLPGSARSLAQPGPLPIRPNAITRVFEEWH